MRNTYCDADGINDDWSGALLRCVQPKLGRNLLRGVPTCLGKSSLLFSLFFFFFFPGLGTEPRALRSLGKRSTAELNPQPLTSVFSLEPWAQRMELHLSPLYHLLEHHHRCWLIYLCTAKI